MVPDQPGDGLAVDLAVDDRHLLVTSGGESLGRYPLNQTEVERLTGDRFRLTIGSEVLYFHAEDALGFSYEGMPAISGSGPSTSRTLREFWRRSRTAAAKAPVARPIETERAGGHAKVSLAETLAPPPVETAVTSPPVEPASPPPPPPVLPVAEPAKTEVVDLPAVEAEEALALSLPPASPTPPPPVLPVGADGKIAECKGRRADGGPCGSMAVGPSGFCFAHDPDLAGERQMMTDRVNRTVSRARATDPDLESLVARLESAVTQVQEGTLDPQQALAMASLVQAMCDTIGVSRNQK